MDNRRDGHSWERDVITWFSEYLGIEKFTKQNEATAQVASSRLMSKALDNCKVDVWFGKVADHILRLKVQCKKTLSRSKSHKNIDVSSLDEMIVEEGDIKLLFTRLTVPRGKTQQTTYKELVTMDIEDFKIFLDAYNRLHQS